METLYHGSKTFIKDYLKPNICYELESYVHATDEYEYALIRSGNFDITIPRIREEHDIDHHELCELYPGAFEEVFDRPGYIYVVNKNDFDMYRPTEYVADKKVKIIDMIKINNVLEELKSNDKIKLIRDEDSEDYWKQIKGGKQGYIKRKIESSKPVINKRETV